MSLLTIKRRPQAQLGEWAAQLPPVIAQVLASRGIVDAQQLDLGLRHLPHFNQLKGTIEAAERLAQAIQADHAICICGDFDADGATVDTNGEK